MSQSRAEIKAEEKRKIEEQEKKDNINYAIISLQQRTKDLNILFDEYDKRKKKPYKAFVLRGYKPYFWPIDAIKNSSQHIDNVSRVDTCVSTIEHYLKKFDSAYRIYDGVRKRVRETMTIEELYNVFKELYNVLGQIKLLENLKGECKEFTRLQSLATEKKFKLNKLYDDIEAIYGRLHTIKTDEEISAEAKQLIRQIEAEVMLEYKFPAIPTHTPRGGGRRRTRRRGASRRSKTLRGRRRH